MSQTVSPSTSRCYGLRGSRARGACRAPSFIAFSRQRHRLRAPLVSPVRPALGHPHVLLEQGHGLLGRRFLLENDQGSIELGLGKRRRGR